MVETDMVRSIHLPKIQLIETLLQKVVFDMPYNSATAIYEYYGYIYGVHYGSGCLGQAVYLRHLLNENGIENVYYLKDYRHHALLIIEKEYLIYLDPYLLQIKPVILKTNRAFSTTTVDAIPKYKSNEIPKSKISVTFSKDSGAISVRKTRWDTSHKEPLIHNFSYLLKNISAVPGNYNDEMIVFSPERTSVSIRFASKDKLTTAHIILPLFEYAHSKKCNNVYFKYKDFEGSCYQAKGKRYMPQFDRITRYYLNIGDDEARYYLLYAANNFLKKINTCALYSENAQNG